MSDPVTNSEVEDVLSSIRRLVGDTKRPTQESDGVPERLVLTPQLRVATPEVLLLEPENAVTPTENWYEFEEPPLPENGAWEEEDHSEPQQAAEAEYYVESEEPAGFAEASKVYEPAQPVEQRADVSALSAKIAALETAIAKTSDQWEPDGAGRDAYAGTQSPAMNWQDNIELDGTGTPLREVPAVTPVEASEHVHHASAPAVDVDAIEEQVIDEDMLRALVAEIVKSELQGELGERITRNVRKLVRREIHRALAAQALD